MRTGTLTNNGRSTTILAATRAKGVKRVARELKDGFAGGGRRADADIVRSAGKALARTVLHHEQIRIEVNDGWVIPEGEVDRRRASMKWSTSWL